MRIRTVTMLAATALVGIVVGWVAMRTDHSEITGRHSAKQTNTPVLSPEVVEIFALTSAKARPKQLAEHLHNLSKDEELCDQEALFGWMLQQKPNYVSVPAWQWLVNEAMDKLCQQAKPSAKLTGVLVAMYRDPATDDVLRDYAIQHLAHYLQPASIWEPCEHDLDRRKLIVDVLLQASSQTDTSIAGTALQGLNLALLARDRLHNSTDVPVVLPIDVLDSSQLEQAALGLVRAKEHNRLATITALQVCAQHQFRDVLPEARRIAVNGSEKTALRVAAISVLGQLGTKHDDDAVLQPLASANDVRISRAAETAWHNLSTGPSI